MNTSTTNAKQPGKEPRPAYRVFISSTYEDLKEFRTVASQALSNVEAIPMGMERFTAGNLPVIERCYEEIEQCQFFVSIVGFRYGDLYPNSTLSYSELEFNKAEELGIPILIFIQEGTLDSTKLDPDDFSRLTQYKKRLKSSGTRRITTSFKTADELKLKLSQALDEEFKRASNSRKKGADKEKEEEEAYLKGAATFKKFLLMPGAYCGDANEAAKNVRLRVRFDGTFGSWHLKEELFEAFEIDIGRAIFFNDLFVLGVDFSDMGDEAKHIDCFATGKAAEWILDNHITKGSVFEGNFSLEWKYVKNVAGKSRLQLGASDAYIAKLVLRDPDLKLCAQGKNTRTLERETMSQDSILDLLSKLM